jgi:hypothetical protein
MRIRIAPLAESSSILRGRVIYRAYEWSIDFVPDHSGRELGVARVNGGSSVLIGTLSIEVEPDTGRLLYPWGYHPREAWRETELQFPHADLGLAHADEGRVFIPGTSYLIAEVGEWVTFVDLRSGCLRLRRPNHVDDDEQVQIAEGVVLGLNGGELNSLWMLLSQEGHPTQ